jgi:hypothetical protein
MASIEETIVVRPVRVGSGLILGDPLSDLTCAHAGPVTCLALAIKIPARNERTDDFSCPLFILLRLRVLLLLDI